MPSSTPIQAPVALITGGAHGLGQATCMALAQRNVNLVIADIDATAAQETAVACRQSGVVVHCLQTDLASAEGPSDMINQTLAVCGRLDILVNNAAYAIAEPFLDMTANEWDRVYALNIRAVALATAAGGRVMCQQGGGRIINILEVVDADLQVS